MVKNEEVIGIGNEEFKLKSKGLAVILCQMPIMFQNLFIHCHSKKY
jgi:hypothetical protein